MSGDAPFRRGPFAVDEAMRLSPAEAADTPAFRLRWRDRAVHVRMAQAPDGSDSGVLALRTIVGRVPSTAERAVGREGAARRRRAFSVMLGWPGLLPRTWCVRLLSDHRVGLEAELRLELPASAATLLGALSLFLLELAPYLDLLDETGMGAAGLAADDAGDAGTAKTWPG
ncbi:MAG TPA: hypothetical protein VGH36_00105 [Acetobacteraceae bacterium]|jgi:hypothetical protein